MIMETYELYGGIRHRIEIVKKENYKGIDYIITSNGLYPCAYIDVSHTFYKGVLVENHTLQNFPCHGGVTYAWKKYPTQAEEKEDSWFIGWDYAHCEYDYIPRVNPLGHKWTLGEIEMQCKAVIDYVKKRSEI